MASSITKHPWLQRLILAAILLAALVLISSFVYRLPNNTGNDRSYAVDDGLDTTLGQEFAAELAQNPGKTGVFLLPHGRDAFAARALLARKAEKSIDLQYYMYHQDTVGKLLTYEILRAADRGIRVRMLIDDIYGNQGEETWVALNAHPNIEVRLWNPWVRGKSRLIQSLFRVKDINYRMHAKSFTVDNQATILGGRNIGDEYFDADIDVAFSDVDVLAIGPAVGQVSTQFDLYWNNDFAYPVKVLIRPGTDAELDTLRTARTDFYQQSATLDYVTALHDSDLAHGLNDGSLAFSWSVARVIHDSPEKKTLGAAGREELLITQLAPYITAAQKTVAIVSPYFVPGHAATEALCKLAQDGVEVRILTNSLASNDVSAVHAGYSKYRRPLLRCGVQLFELDESIKDREGKAFTWLPGLKKSSLHAKSMVFDGDVMFVGSFNFDQRSLHINNEIGLVFRAPEVAGAAARNFEENIGNIAFKVEFASEGGQENMHWVGGQAGPDTVMEKEPYATTGQKLMVGILKWLPIDSQL